MTVKQPMNRRWVKLSIAGTCILLISAILNFPASLALGWVKQNSPTPVEWQQVDGSIFNADVFGLSIKTEQGRLINLDRLSTSTSILSLLSGTISTEFEFWKNNSSVSGKSALTPGSWKISDASGEIFISDLNQIFPEIVLFGVSGEFKIQQINLSGEYYQLPNSGNFELEASRLKSSMFNLSQPIGSYRVSADNIDNDNIIVSIVNLTGENQVFINVKTTIKKREKRLGVNGFTWLSEKADPSLNELLLLMGTLENNRILINEEWNF